MTNEIEENEIRAEEFYPTARTIQRTMNRAGENHKQHQND